MLFPKIIDEIENNGKIENSINNSKNKLGLKAGIYIYIHYLGFTVYVKVLIYRYPHYGSNIWEK